MTKYYDSSEGNLNRIGQRIRAQQQGQGVLNSASVRELSSYSISRIFGPGYEEVSAPTTNPAKPRALAMGYNRDTETLVIIFRAPTKRSKATGNSVTVGDAPWVQYDNIPLDMWEDLKRTDSVGKYLKYSGLDDHPYQYTNYGSLPRKRPDNFIQGQNPNP